MARRVGRELRHHGLAILALFVALGGAAYAGSKVGPDEIARNAVTGKHIKPDAVRGSDIKEEAVGAAQLRGFDFAEAATESLDVIAPGTTNSEQIRMAEAPDGHRYLVAQCVWNEFDSELTAVLVLGTDQENVLLMSGSHPSGIRTEPGGNGLTLAHLEQPLGLANLQQATGTFSSITPDGKALQGTFHVAINDDPNGRDCTFSVVAHG